MGCNLFCVNEENEMVIVIIFLCRHYKDNKIRKK